MKKDYKILVNAPIEEVFSIVDNKENRSLGEDAKIELHGHEDSERKEGLKYHLKIGGFDFEGEIIAYKRPILFGVGLKHRSLSGTFFYRLEAVDDHTTKLVCELEVYEGTKFKKKMIEISFPALSKITEMHLKSIKKVSENKITVHR